MAYFIECLDSRKISINIIQLHHSHLIFSKHIFHPNDAILEDEMASFPSTGSHLFQDSSLPHLNLETTDLRSELLRATQVALFKGIEFSEQHPWRWRDMSSNLSARAAGICQDTQALFPV